MFFHTSFFFSSSCFSFIITDSSSSSIFLIAFTLPTLAFQRGLLASYPVVIGFKSCSGNRSLLTDDFLFLRPYRKVPTCCLRLGHGPSLPFPLKQWSPTRGMCTPGGKRRLLRDMRKHLAVYVKLKQNIIS